jgi:predicted transcriptional regulator
MDEQSVHELLQQAVASSEIARSHAQDACVRAGMAYQTAIDALEVAEKALRAAQEAANGTLRLATVLGGRFLAVIATTR